MSEIWPLIQFYGSNVLLIAGAALILIGAIGMLRLPDAMTQVHATGMIETLGAMFLIFGMMLKAETGLVSVKLLIILFFLAFTSPAAGHALTRAIIHYRNRPWQHRKAEADSDGDATS